MLAEYYPGPDIHGIVVKSSLNVGGQTVAGSEVFFTPEAPAAPKAHVAQSQLVV